MKREIKFRAWVKQKDNHFMATQGSPDLETLQSFMFHYGDEQTLMEYTGLKDKNGKEIYEGDYIVDRYPIDEDDLSLGHNEDLLPVIWCDEDLIWCVDTSYDKDSVYLVPLVNYFGEHLEVKGNIYENG